MNLDRRNFPEPYQYLEVASGEKGIVWGLDVGMYTGFIRKVGINWYTDCYYEWNVDGRLVEKILRSIEMKEPDEYEPPIIAEKKIQFVFFNNGDEAITAGVLCSGELVRLLMPHPVRKI